MRSTDLLRAIALPGLALIAFACGGEASGGDSDRDDAAMPAAGGEGRHLGLFFSEDFVEFEPCAGEPMNVSGPLVADLVEMHAAMTPGVEPLEAVFVDVWGEVVEEGSRRRLEVLELRRVAYEGGGCSRDDSSVFFRGSGTEPFWSIEIREDGLVWTTPEGSERMAHSGLYDGPQGEWMFDGVDATGGPVLTVSFVQAPCLDQMSGAWYHLSLEVAREDRTFNGCAYMSPDAEGFGP